MTDKKVIDLDERRRKMREAADEAAAEQPDAFEDVRNAAVEEVNKKFCVVNMSGKVGFMQEVFDSDTNQTLLHFSKNADMENLYANDKVLVGYSNNGKPQIKSKYEIWLESKDRREYRHMIMDPSKPPRGSDETGVYNMFRGWPWPDKLRRDRPSKMEKWRAIRHHIQHVICDDNKDLARWLYAWMAERFKNPQNIAGVAIVLMGEEGIGKGTFITHILGGCYEPSHFVTVADAKHLFGNFNKHMANALLVFADEAFFPGNHEYINKFKNMITEKQFLMEPKGFDAFQVVSRRAFAVASNNTKVIAAGDQSRRFTVFQVNEDFPNDREYFKVIFDELQNGGREEMLRYLLQEDFSDVDPYIYFLTKALVEQREMNRDDMHTYLFGLLNEGILPRNAGDEEGKSVEIWPMDDAPHEIKTSRMLNDYLQREYVKGAHPNEKRSAETLLGIALRKYIPAARRVQRYDPNLKRVVWQYELPPLKQARKDYNRHMRTDYWTEKVEPTKPKRKPARKK